MSLGKKLLSGVIAAAMLGTVVIPAMAKEFPDTVDHWGKDAVSVWSDRGVVKGDDQGNFRPDDSVTRAETATILDNLIGYQKQSNKVFSDVAKEDWYAGAISRLYEAQVMTGYEDGTVRPSAAISRQEASVMIARAFGLETDSANVSSLDVFGDRDQVGDWAQNAVALMADRGYIQGSDGLFRPTDPITRAEIVTILNNMVAIYADGTQSVYTGGDYSNKIAVIKADVTFNGVSMAGAVISPAVTGRVNFNSGTVISGQLLDLTTDATIGTSGATIGSQSSPNKSDDSSSDNSYNGGSSIINGGGSWGGGSSGGSSGGGSSSTSYTVTFNPNGGAFGGSTQSLPFLISAVQP